MDQFRIQIVEDELLVAMDLAERLKQSGYDIVDINDNADDAITAFREHLPDLVLLDITIRGKKSGIDVAHDINDVQPTPFIYITAHADAVTVNKAKNTFPAAYVIKPFTTSSLLVSIELALHNFAFQNEQVNDTAEIKKDSNIYLKQNHVFIKDGYKFIKIFLNDILYLSAEDNYVRIVTGEKQFLIRNTLTRTTEILQRNFFVRVHRSFCINTNHIDSFSEQEVIIAGQAIPIGRNYKEELGKIFNFK